MSPLSYISNDACVSDTVWLLVRHGEKVSPPSDQPFLDVAITVKGYRDASRFGKALNHAVSARFVSISSSPLTRCRETSTAILEGMEVRAPIEISTLLGAPGPYVYDEDLAGQSFRALFPKNIVKLQVEGEHIPGFRTVREGSALLLTYMLGQHPGPGLRIFVTHDVIIAALIGYLIGSIPDIPDWIKYLQGACFFKHENHIFMDLPEGSFNVTKKTREFIESQED